MKKLITRSCEEIMTTVYKPIEFVIDGLLAQGLYILAGAPKVGKSWLALDMCLSIAKGESVLGLKLHKELLCICVWKIAMCESKIVFTKSLTNLQSDCIL